MHGGEDIQGHLLGKKSFFPSTWKLLGRDVRDWFYDFT